MTNYPNSIYQEEHLIFQQSVRKFAAIQLLPYIDQWEEQAHFPSSIFPKLASEGFLGILIDEEWGGVGGDYVLAGAWCEELGRIPSVGLSVAIHMHAVVITPAIQRLGSPEAKARWLKSAVQGTAIGAYAFTEPGAGSDLTQIRTSAIKDGDYYVLNGSKIFITNGARADFVLVLAKTSSAPGYDSYTTFIVDTKSPGFSVSRTLSKLGWHCSDTAELNFVDLRVHQSMILGQIGQGWHNAMVSLQWERIMLSLNAIGGASQCLESTVKYINDRKAFGKTIGSFDFTQATLATFWSKLLAGRALCHQCLRLLSNNKECRKESSLAKLYVCELAIQIADRCLQLHGGYGYTTEFLPERWLRDLRLNTIGGGTSEIMARIAAKEIFS